MTQQTNAQRLADELQRYSVTGSARWLAAEELRRLDAIEKIADDLQDLCDKQALKLAATEAERDQLRAHNDELRSELSILTLAHDQLRAQVERLQGGEPFGYFKAEPFGWTDCAKTDEGAIPLYAAQPAASAMVAWQPIETAPKDGTDVLVMYTHIDTQVVHNAFWLDGEGVEPNEIGWWSYERSEVSRIKLDGWMTPTRWMPLPPLPVGIGQPVGGGGGVMADQLETEDGRYILVDCGRCKGCGEQDASGFPCQSCEGRGFMRYRKPSRDYQAAGARAFIAGKSLDANPYRYGWPSHAWMLGWFSAKEKPTPPSPNEREAKP